MAEVVYVTAHAAEFGRVLRELCQVIHVEKPAKLARLVPELRATSIANWFAGRHLPSPLEPAVVEIGRALEDRGAVQATDQLRRAAGQVADERKEPAFARDVARFAEDITRLKRQPPQTLLPREVREIEGVAHRLHGLRKNIVAAQRRGNRHASEHAHSLASLQVPDIALLAGRRLHADLRRSQAQLLAVNDDWAGALTEYERLEREAGLTSEDVLRVGIELMNLGIYGCSLKMLDEVLLCMRQASGARCQRAEDDLSYRDQLITAQAYRCWILDYQGRYDEFDSVIAVLLAEGMSSDTRAGLLHRQGRSRLTRALHTGSRTGAYAAQELLANAKQTAKQRANYFHSFWLGRAGRLVDDPNACRIEQLAAEPMIDAGGSARAHAVSNPAYIGLALGLTNVDYEQDLLEAIFIWSQDRYAHGTCEAFVLLGIVYESRNDHDAAAWAFAAAIELGKASEFQLVRTARQRLRGCRPRDSTDGHALLKNEAPPSDGLDRVLLKFQQPVPFVASAA